MGRKNILTIFVVALLVAALFPANAIALPDVPPSCSLRSNTDHTDTTAILTAVSVDTLGNAGVDNIELLEGGAHMSSKDCYDAGTCVYTRTVVRTTEGWRTYQAVCTDRAGNEARSGEVRVFFEGTNSPPVIDSASPASPFTMEESETQRFEVDAHDPDLDPLTYEWRVDGSTVAGPGTRDYYYFSEDVTGSDTFTVSVYVRDPAGALAVHAWTVHVTEVVGEVTVSITEDYRTECQIFSFTAHPDTPDPVDHYEWDFGDGLATTSAGTSVTHQFRDDGTYTVRVTAVEADGDRFTGSTTAHVEDVDPYSVVATCETPVIAEGETAHFAGSGSASCAADPISSYAWNFGDGHSDSGAALRTPSHTYTASGTYTVTLSVHDEDSFTTATCIQRVTDSDPVASFTWDPARPVAGDVISFTDTSVSYDGIVSWEWDIYCDGVIESRIRNPSTPAPVPGSYDICLTVREADGDSDMARETVVVSDGSADTTPVADLVAVPASGDAPLRVHFECSATGGEVPLRYVINFGDGTPPAISGSVDHTYAVPGDYTATCRVTDVDGDSDSDSEMIRVTDGTIDTVPVVELVATPTSGDDPLDVHFECLVTDGNAPFAYSIDFGDGTPFAIGSVVDHTYAAPGDYTATCRVWDVDGDSDRDSEVITVRDSSVDTVPVVDLVATPSGGASPLDVHFDCLVTDGNAPFIFFMEFGDGTPLAIGDSFDHTYAVDGDYTATCRVWDREGDFDMDSELITVGSDLAPVVELVATPTSGNEILDVHFECVWVGGSEPVDYRIDFGDRYAPVDASVADHSYDPIYVDFFTYDAICHAWDADGDVGRDTEFITVFNNEPLVELLATPDSGDSPLDVHFECVASGGDAPYRFNIDTGDGYISRGATLDYTYAADGTYTASCAVRDTDGDTVLADHVITVSVPGDEIPVARMRVAPTSGDEPLDVDVLCAGSGGDGALTYMIDWGDGTRDFAELASHTYTSDGRYRVSCRVTDEDGDSDVVSEGILVFDVSAALDAEFTWSPLSPGVLEDVLFDATIVSSDPITRIVWDFDDGTRSFVEDPTHAFAAAGSYDVILSVWDAGGHFDSVSHTITLSADPTDPPVASLTVDPVSGTEPLTVEAACTGTDGDAPLGYVIDWGDGSVPFAGSRAMHTYDDDGLYDVVCTVTDADGESAADTVTVDVADTVPTLSFDWTPESPDELESVFFDADVSAYDGIDSVEWDFGDGEFDTSGDLSPVHEYADAGSYDVTVTVTDGDGSVVSATDTIHVAIDAPTARLLADPSSGTEPLTVDFVCAATGGNAPYTYEIDFGDGTAPEASNTATHTYDQDGVYLATCTVTDNDGDADTDSADVEVLDTVPSVFFTYLPADPVEFEEVYFFGEVSGYDEPVTWEWDFGDGATSTDLEPVHAFDAPGVYTVTLSATDADGSTEWHSEDVTVGDDAPVAILLADPMTGPEGLEVTFNCTVVGGTEPFTYVVDYGTGDSTTDADSTYVYSAPGTYTATCEVTDFDSDVSTSAPVSIVIDDNAPVVDLIVSLADPAAPGWEGDMYDFECVITGGDDPMDVTIDFGDGSAPVLGTSASHAYTDEGMYIASCEVFDADLDYGYDEEVVDVANNVPVVDVFVDEASAFEPHTVEYNCNVGDGNEPFDYLVEFGDGDTSTSPTGTHDYPDPGSYPLRCTVTDDDGDIGWDEVGIHVWDNPPVVSMTATPVVGLEGVTVHFDCDISGGNEDFDVTLDFDEGAPYEAFGTSERHHSATHVYAFEGEYNATCRVTDDDGDVGDDWEVITVIDNPPVVDLEVTPDSGLEPLTVDYECTVGGGNEPFGFSVDLDGDGFEDTTSPSGTYTYTVPGIYAMTCTVTDADGDVDSDTVDVEVIDNPPVVDLVPSHMGGPEGSDIFFECLVSEGNEPFDYFINFDDGSTTTADAEWHTFPFEGLYNVSCEVTDDDGDVGLDWALINISNAGPVVNVEVDVPSGLEPLTVEYTCDAAGGNEPYDYEIDFDDGSAHEFTPTGTHTYAVPGIYDLTCTVTDDDGDVGSDHVGIHVIDNPPVVDLTYTYVGELWEGVVVDFTCGWTDGNADFDVTLDFGDGAPLVTSSDGTPVTASHTYSLEGLYTATCTVIDDDGDVDSDSEDLDILNNPPVVNLEVDTISGFEPLSVDYNCTVGDGNEPFDYLIVFDDGTTSTSPTGTHDYPVPGTYEMTCTVTDADGDVASDHEGIHVIDNPPVVSFSADPMEGPEGVEVDFDCSWTGGNPDFDMTIVFGDGASETYFGPDTSYTTSHTYPLEGVYTASCEVRDDDLDVDTETLDINVTNNVPVVNVWVNETSGLEPHSIEYICSAGGGNAPYSYSVDIDGDGFEDTTSPTGTYTYTTPGLYDLTCTVTDDDGDMGSDTQRVEVLDDAPLVDLTYSYSGTLWEGVEVEFTCDIFGGNPDYTVVLIYGDGSTWSTATSGTSVSASHTYPLEGDFNATCRVTDSDGDVGEDSELFTVANNPPVTNLYTNISIVDTSTGVEPLSLLFNCTVGDGNDPFDYVIDFGDGSASVPASTASHTYVQDGTYSATCTVTDTDGDSDIDVETVIVYDTEPDANFNYSPSAPVEGDAVSFTDASTAYDGIVAWDWDLGDGNTSTAADPSHIYGLEGSYLVTLCVTDGDGDVTCHSELVDVANNVPVVTVTAVPDTGDEPLDSTITCSATGGNAPLTYLVQYGDGDSTTSTTSSHTYDQDGSYPVVCMVTDDDGDIGTGFATVAVDDTAPSAAFTFLPEEPGAGDTVDFTDTSVPGHDAIVSWAWDFDEDGVTDSTDQDPSWVFATAGVYTVELTATDSDGSTDTTSRDVIVDVSMPPPTIVPLPSAISVTNESASITWGTTQPADSLVLYGLAPDALSSSAYSGTLEFSHTLPLLGLTEDTTYYYNVTSCNSFARCTTVGPYSFTTLLSASPDVTPPVVVLSSPADGAIDADGNVTVSYTVTDDLAAGLTCDVYSDTSGAWGIDDTQVVGNPGSGSFDYVGLSDGIYTWNVECEDGTNTAFAPADFTFNVILPAATCGDGTLDTGEECDDGNTVSGDSCSALCVIEYCSDSIIQSLVEECDDGNLANGDGCSAVCTLESMPATCGNGAIDPGEECDGFLLGSFECFDLDSFTGGTLSCSPTCTFDTSSCTGTPTGVCGDGVVNPGESCDGADWGPVSGCDYFGYTSGTLSCTGTCSFDTSACTAGPFPIVNSWVYGGFYAANDNADVTETTVTGTTMLNATVQGTPIATITDSTLTYAILTNVTPISNCTVIGTPSEYSTLSDSPCVDAYIDPSTIVNSDTTGSSVRDSTVTDSTATQSGITNSDVANSDFHHCTITDSVVDGLVGSYCTVSGSTVTDSSVENSTITDSTVTDSTVIDSTVTNSTVNNSTLVDMIVTDADISDGIICSGTVSDSVTYDADANGCANLTDVVNYPPTAVISASSTSGTDSLAVDFSGDSSTDPNIPGPLGDSLTYSWDFDASDGITADATGVNVSHTFGVGTHVVTLTVTDSFGGSDTETVTITVTSSGSSGGSSSGGGGGGGGGGGSAGRIYILTVTPDNPTQSFYLRTGDTVKYMSGTDDVSFVFRGILADKVTMGVSSEHTYKEYTLDEDTKYNFNLNDDPANDMAVIPTNLYLGAGNVSFELLNFEERKPILILPPAKPAPRVVEPEPEAEAGEAESQVEPEAEPETVEPETEEAYSEGKLEFIESLSLRKNAPLWAGIGVALLIILAGLGVYFLATRKEED